MSPVYVKFKIIVSLTTHKKWDILKDKLHRHIFMFIWIKIHLQIIQYFGVHSLSIKIALTKNTQKNLLLLNKCKLLMWQTNVKHFIKGFFFFFHLYFSLFFYCKMTQYQHENTVQRLIWYIYIWFMLTFLKFVWKKVGVTYVLTWLITERFTVKKLFMACVRTRTLIHTISYLKQKTRKSLHYNQTSVESYI